MKRIDEMNRERRGGLFDDPEAEEAEEAAAVDRCPTCGGPLYVDRGECGNCGSLDTGVEQGALFDLDSLEWWRKHWQGMPEYVHEDLTPWRSIRVHFETREHMEAFAELVGQTVTEKTQSLWYPKAEIGRYADKRYIRREDR